MNLKLSALSWSIYSVFSLIFTVWRFNIIDIVINRHRRHWILFTELSFRKLERFHQKWNSYRRKKKVDDLSFLSDFPSPPFLSILTLYLPIFSSPPSRQSFHGTVSFDWSQTVWNITWSFQWLVDSLNPFVLEIFCVIANFVIFYFIIIDIIIIVDFKIRIRWSYWNFHGLLFLYLMSSNIHRFSGISSVLVKKNYNIYLYIDDIRHELNLITHHSTKISSKIHVRRFVSSNRSILEFNDSLDTRVTHFITPEDLSWFKSSKNTYQISDIFQEHLTIKFFRDDISSTIKSTRW